MNQIVFYAGVEILEQEKNRRAIERLELFILRSCFSPIWLKIKLSFPLDFLPCSVALAINHLILHGKKKISPSA